MTVKLWLSVELRAGTSHTIEINKGSFRLLNVSLVRTLADNQGATDLVLSTQSKETHRVVPSRQMICRLTPYHVEQCSANMIMLYPHIFSLSAEGPNTLSVMGCFENVDEDLQVPPSLSASPSGPVVSDGSRVDVQITVKTESAGHLLLDARQSILIGAKQWASVVEERLVGMRKDEVKHFVVEANEVRSLAATHSLSLRSKVSIGLRLISIASNAPVQPRDPHPDPDKKFAFKINFARGGGHYTCGPDIVRVKDDKWKLDWGDDTVQYRNDYSGAYEEIPAGWAPVVVDRPYPLMEESDEE
ncbi:hypothetical protein BD626DRAFT_503097 [Schizophyllum amplum]|uniref:Nucleoplasmin-like domain-containing protein n=1 Tax=Schizophyllum amplum TaxID=97359 RepID=A0A550C7V0_9AGAR|nr:hypothetical protein BD626DRAFT_503097 [Auriculariopsis ampla]